MGVKKYNLAEQLWVPCTVKRYTSREEMNTSMWEQTYKGNTIKKNGANVALSINTTGGRGASVSTDQFYKDNCSIKIAENETYVINITNNIRASETAAVVVRYLDTNNIITSVTYRDQPEDITLTPNVETYIYFGVDIPVGVVAVKEMATINVIRQSAWHDTPVYVRGRYPNIFDVDSVQNVIRNNVATTSGFSNVDGLITLTKSVGNDGRYAFNEPLSFEANEVYELTFDVLLEGTNSSNYIAIAVLDTSNMVAISTDLFNYPVEKDTWARVTEELTLSATQGSLSIQARNTGNSIKIKNVVLKKKGYTWNEQ